MFRTTRSDSKQQAIALDASPHDSPSKKKRLTATATTTTSSQPEIIVLVDDDDTAAAAVGFHAQYEASAMKAFANEKKKQKQKKNGKTPSPARAAAAAAASGVFASLRSGQRRRKTDKQAAATPAAPDAIDVDDLTATICDNPSTLYRRDLGPLRFDFIDSFRHHNYVNEKQHPNMQKLMPKLYKELLEYRLNLPSEVSGSIFVRSLESRMDIVRALITGPEDTPYANGCFLFDIYLSDYPKTAPKVKFLTTGQGRVRFNPNLYNCGKVCLSLLGTWAGPGWIANKSTLLQVLVSIQGLILVPEPYYNEPSYETLKGSANGQKASDLYSSRIRKYTLQHAIDDHLDAIMKKKTLDYSEFHTVMIRHYCQRAHAICLMMDEWVAKDATLKHLADKIRPKLMQLVEEYGQQKVAACNAEDAVDVDDDLDSKPAALKTAPEVYEIDD